MLSFANVSKSFGTSPRIEALRGISLAVSPGEFVALVGPSGSGKTTIVRLAAGLIVPDEGAILLDGVAPDVYRRRQSIGYVSQRLALLPWRTAYENARLPAELGHRVLPEIRSEIERVFALLRIAEFADLYPSELSGGIAQRVAVARALLCDSPIVLLDEPFSALDAINRERLWADIASIFLREKATGLLVTHHITEAVVMADRILVLSPRPARIIGELRVAAERPRTLEFHRTEPAREAERGVRELLQRGEV
jgi:NitT/TauT family transport system ATP-binding protein